MYISATGSIGSYGSILPTLGGGGESLLLDLYPGAEMALSLRLLSSTYTGPAIELSNGTTAIDIGFVDGELDTAAIAAHCGASEGRIITWYDQSGNGSDMIQTSATPLHRPKIYDGTTGIELLGGKPVLTTDASGHLDQPGYVGAPACTSFNVITKGSGSVGNCLMGNGATNYAMVTQNGNTTSPHKDSGAVSYRLDGSAAVPAIAPDIDRNDLYDAFFSDQRLLTTHFATSGGITNYTTLTFGYAANPGAFGMFNSQEVILYHSDKTVDEVAIETSINDYYSVY